MPTNLHIAWRFLTNERRSMLMSLAGIVCGVAFFIVTQAQTSGFEQFFIHTILGSNGAIKIEDRLQDTLRAFAGTWGEDGSFALANRESRKYVEGIEEPARLREALARFENISGVSEVVSGSVRLQTGARAEDARVYGVRLEDHLRVSDLASQIRFGSLEDFRSQPLGIVVGAAMARRLNLAPGDTVRLDYRGELRPYRVAAIYETGVADIDRVRVYLHLGEARSLLRRPFGATFLQVALRDPDRAREEAERIEAVLQHSASSWQEREKTWLEVFRALRVSSAITVSSLIIISGLGMFNTLAMQVMRKTREIAILRSMGYTRADVSGVFLWQGALVLAGGLGGGCALGAGVTWVVSRIPIRIRGIFSTDHFVVNWSASHYLAAAATATIVVLLASYVPARRAAKLEPAGIIRGTSQ